MKNILIPKFSFFVFGLALIFSMNFLSFWASGQSSLLNKPVSSQQAKTITERIESRKKEYNQEPTATQLSKISSQCQDIKTKISQLKEKDFPALDNSYEVYDQIANQVSVMINRLKQQAVSTAGIQTALNQYIEAANSFLISTDSYKSALADIESMDCQTKTADFWITLLDAKTSIDKLSESSDDITKKVKNISTELLKTKQYIASY